MLTFRSFVLVCASMLFAFSAQADRTITDQLGRQVTIPDHVDKVVVLQHQTLNILVQLNAQQDIVGVMSSWKNSSGLNLRALCRRLLRCRHRAISPA